MFPLSLICSTNMDKWSYTELVTAVLTVKWCSTCIHMYNHTSFPTKGYAALCFSTCYNPELHFSFHQHSSFMPPILDALDRPFWHPQSDHDTSFLVFQSVWALIWTTQTLSFWEVCGHQKEMVNANTSAHALDNTSLYFMLIAIISLFYSTASYNTNTKQLA